MLFLIDLFQSDVLLLNWPPLLCTRSSVVGGTSGPSSHGVLSVWIGTAPQLVVAKSGLGPI